MASLKTRIPTIMILDVPFETELILLSAEPYKGTNHPGPKCHHLAVSSSLNGLQVLHPVVL